MAECEGWNSISQTIDIFENFMERKIKQADKNKEYIKEMALREALEEFIETFSDATDSIDQFQKQIKTYREWLFSYKDDTRLLALTMKLRFTKIFGTLVPESTIKGERHE